MASYKGQLRKKDIFFLISLLIISCLLRTLFLGGTFQSADNAALADRIVHNRGYAWMVREYYGFLINFIVKIVTAIISFGGIRLTEFWWKLPVALFGSAQGLVTFFFLRRWFRSLRLAFSGAAFLAILPIHVMQSRYLWGYEVLGIFFLTIFFWQWMNFLEKPTVASGRRASVAMALYLISHGYILPFLPAFFFSLFILPAERIGFEEKKVKIIPIIDRFRLNLELFFRFRVWLYPLLFSPLTIGALRRAQQKKIKINFYLGYLRNFIEDTGIFLFIFILIGLLFYALKRPFSTAHFRHSHLLLFLIISVCYLLPFFVAAPPGVTVVGGYMSQGIYWLLLFSLVIWDSVFNGNLRVASGQPNSEVEIYLDKRNGDRKGDQERIKESDQITTMEAVKTRAKKKIEENKIKGSAALVVMLILFLATCWGTVESIFFSDHLFDPTLVKAGRGNVAPDPGTKAAGYLLFKYFPDDKYPAASWPILVLHRNIEPPCVRYYWRREAIAFYDYSFDQTKEAFFRYKDKVSLIVADSEQVQFISQDQSFEPRIILYYRGQPRLFIFSRDKNFLPLIKGDVKEFNQAFDRELSSCVSFK